MAAVAQGFEESLWTVLCVNLENVSLRAGQKEVCFAFECLVVRSVSEAIVKLNDLQASCP